MREATATPPEKPRRRKANGADGAAKAAPRRVKATPTKQTPIPGTQQGSDELRRVLTAFNQAKYDSKECADIMRRLKPELEALLGREGVDSISCEIDVGDVRRVAITRLDTKTQLTSELQPLDGE